MRSPEQIEKLIPTPHRAAQRFPRLSNDQLAMVRRFAFDEPRDLQPGIELFNVGDLDVPVWFLLGGSAELLGHDGLDKQDTLRTLDSGQFTGELHQLAGLPSLLGARAGAEGCTALPLDSGRLRALIVGSAELGELIMRAFILRRVGLMEAGLGPVLLGRHGDGDLVRLEGFLRRCSYPHLVLDCATERGRTLIQGLGLGAEDLPLMVCPCGRVLRRPTNEEAGAWLGITPVLPHGTVYDVVVVGSGPAGLATAVYAGSEGLSVLVVDQAMAGGQAGASARIENYLGFPTGISGLALTGRALSQAQKFGADIAIPLVATKLLGKCVKDPDGTFEVVLSEQGPVLARTIVVASGARYRRPELPDLAAFEGAGVHYWASPVEAKLCEGGTAALIGGGNSAGQAAVFLAGHVRRLVVAVRGPGLEATMSRYLIDRLSALPNVEIWAGHQLVALDGEPGTGLAGATFEDRRSGARTRLALEQLFVFIGAEPNTEWLDGGLDLDAAGYIRTGAASGSALTHETSVPGIFAIGDVRSGSTKRVAAAVGEGAAVVAQVHAVLAAAARPSGAAAGIPGGQQPS